MKRHWRPGRIILAVMLVGIAGLIGYFWPKGPLWSISAQNIVGFDEAKDLFYTSSQKGNELWLHTYRLTSGELVSSQFLHLPSYYGPFQWPLTLSGNKHYLIAMSAMARAVSVFSLPDLHSVPIDEPKSYVKYSFGLSQDGACLLLRDDEMDFDRIEIVDLEKAISTELKIPHESVGGDGGFGNHLPTEAMQLTADRRYLVTQVLRGFTVIYDLVQGKEVARTKERAIPRLSANGKSLICLAEGEPRVTIPAIYQLIDGQWVERAPWTAPYVETEWGNFVQTSDNYLVTAWYEVYWDKVSEDSWMSHLPEICKTWLQKVVTPGRVHFRFWDLGSGNLKPELNLAIPLAWSYDLLFLLKSSLFLPLGGIIKVSSDARFVACQDEDRLAVWETSPHRSWTCWLTVGCLAFIALWLTWPRKVQTT